MGTSPSTEIIKESDAPLLLSLATDFSDGVDYQDIWKKILIENLVIIPTVIYDIIIAFLPTKKENINYVRSEPLEGKYFRQLICYLQNDPHLKLLVPPMIICDQGNYVDITPIPIDEMNKLYNQCCAIINLFGKFYGMSKQDEKGNFKIYSHEHGKIKIYSPHHSYTEIKNWVSTNFSQIVVDDNGLFYIFGHVEIYIHFPNGKLKKTIEFDWHEGQKNKFHILSATFSNGRLYVGTEDDLNGYSVYVFKNTRLIEIVRSPHDIRNITHCNDGYIYIFNQCSILIYDPQRSWKLINKINKDTGFYNQVLNDRRSLNEIFNKIFHKLIMFNNSNLYLGDENHLRVFQIKY